MQQMQDGQEAPVIRVLVADVIAQAVADIEALVGFEGAIRICGVARTPTSLFDEVRALKPDVILLNEAFAGIDAIAAAEELAETSPTAKLILLSADPSGDQGVRAANAGVAAVLPLTASPRQLVDAITKVGTSRLQIREPSPPEPAPIEIAKIEPAPVEVLPLVSEPAGPLPPPINEVIPRRARKGTHAKAEIFVVFAGKGGVGKSIIAANLAVALSMRTQAKVAVIDLDLQFGDIGVLLGIDHAHSVEELAQKRDQLDGEFVESIMGAGPAEVRVLLAPTSPELADLVTTGDLRAIVREMAKAFDYIVVDTPAHLEERTLDVIETADHIVLVTNFNVTAVKDTKVTLQLLQSLGIEKERMAIVLNQTQGRANFTRQEVEETLRFRAVTHLPFDPRVVDNAVDHGKPFVLVDPKSDITRQLGTLVDYLAPNDEHTAGARAGDEGKRGLTKAKVNRRRFSLGRS